MPATWCIGMRIERLQHATELKNRSPRASANPENEFAPFAAQLAARSERLRAGVDREEATGRSAFAAQLAARAERLAAGYPSARGIDPAGAAGHSVSSRFAPDRSGYVWGGSLMLILTVSAALVVVWGPPSPPSKPLPSNRIEQAKVDVPAANTPEEKDPPPVSAPRVSPPLMSPPLALQELAKATAEIPPKSSTSQIPLVTQTDPAPLTDNEIRELQSRLAAVGFGPGPIDGVVGPLTQSALRKYAESRAIPNAEATRDLLSRLRTEPPRKK